MLTNCYLTLETPKAKIMSTKKPLAKLCPIDALFLS